MELLADSKINEADAIFCQILEKFPNASEVWHGRACVARSLGRSDLAIGFAGKAIALKKISYYFITLGLALSECGHNNEAEAALNSAVLLNSYDSRAFNTLGCLQNKLEKISEAEMNLRRAIELQPESIGYWRDLIQFYWHHNNYQQAFNIAKDGANFNKNDVFFLSELANICFKLGFYQEAEILFRQVLIKLPRDPIACANLGALLLHLQKLKEAEDYLRIAYHAFPKILENQLNWGMLQTRLGNLDTAKIVLSKAYKQAPEDQNCVLNLGTVLYELKQLDQAQVLYENALSGITTGVQETQEHYKIRYNLSIVMLAKGFFAKGLELMESRYYFMDILDHSSPIPLWNGKTNLKRRLLVRTEQGLGDNIYFARFLPFLLEKCDIVIEVSSTLKTIMERILNYTCVKTKHKFQFIERGQNLPSDIDYQCGLLSLPFLLNCDLFSPSFPYLICEESSSERTDWVHDDNFLNVGLCWAGSPNYAFDQLRSSSLSEWMPLLELKNINFYSLQYDYDKKNLPKQLTPVSFSKDMYLLAQTINQLDLVITVDTAIAHLAGALGKKTWLVNRYGGDWRWYHHIDKKSCCYFDVTIFQQNRTMSKINAWSTVIEEIKSELIRCQNWFES